jgi:hypothetical protein
MHGINLILGLEFWSEAASFKFRHAYNITSSPHKIIRIKAACILYELERSIKNAP